MIMAVTSSLNTPPASPTVSVAAPRKVAYSPAPSSPRPRARPARNRPALEPAPPVEMARRPHELECGLEEALHHNGCYEMLQGLEDRQRVIHRLNSLVRQWIQSISLSRGMHWQDLEKIGGQVVPYGSYMLGISHQGADIDAICIAPQHITRQEYFSSFYALLSYQEEVTHLRAIEECYVPVLKMRYNNVEVDMTFARLNFPEIPEDNKFMDDVDINTLDIKCLRSLNGYRSTQKILKIVPDVKIFQKVLRAVKMWAKAEGVYGNSTGYLGGFAWAVMVAHVCMTQPQETAVEQIHQFFKTFREWSWPNAVALVDYHLVPQGPHLPNSWNPDRNIQERNHVMPVLTPVYPYANATFNVTSNTLQLINGKMKKALKTTAQILHGADDWSSLFKLNHIFHEYDHFLLVIGSAIYHVQWFGLIESKIRYFVNHVEKDSWQTLASARIWPKPFLQRGSAMQNCSGSTHPNGKQPNMGPRAHDEVHPAGGNPLASSTPEGSEPEIARQLWFVGLQFKSDVKSIGDQSLEYKRALAWFKENLYSHARAFRSEDMNIEAAYVHKTDLTGQLSETDVEEMLSCSSPKRDTTPPPATMYSPPVPPMAVAAHMATVACPEALSTARGGGGERSGGGVVAAAALALANRAHGHTPPATSVPSASVGVLSSPSYGVGHSSMSSLTQTRPPLTAPPTSAASKPLVSSAIVDSSHNFSAPVNHLFNSLPGHGVHLSHNMPPPPNLGRNQIAYTYNYHHQASMLASHHQNHLHHMGTSMANYDGRPYMERHWGNRSTTYQRNTSAPLLINQMAVGNTSGIGYHMVPSPSSSRGYGKSPAISRSPSMTPPLVKSSKVTGNNGSRSDGSWSSGSSNHEYDGLTVPSTTIVSSTQERKRGSGAATRGPKGSHMTTSRMGRYGAGTESNTDVSYNSSLDSENGRSISLSSDSFPPESVSRAYRQHNQDRVPHHPISTPPPALFHAISSLPQFHDTSVPPPASPISNRSVSQTPPRSTSPFPGSISSAVSKPLVCSRMASTELCDVLTPLPVQRLLSNPVTFNLATPNGQSGGTQSSLPKTGEPEDLDSVFQ